MVFCEEWVFETMFPVASHYRSGNCWEGRATQTGIEGAGQAINLCYPKAQLKKCFKTAVSSDI